MTNYAMARANMVDGQIRPHRVTDDRLIRALRELPRERFVPKSVRARGYVDDHVPIGTGRFVLAPLVTAWLLQAAAVEPGDVVLDIGCGTGYATALLARLASTVVALDEDVELLDRATEVLAELGIDTAVTVAGPMAAGWPAQAPYQVIVINGAVERVPPAILDQLAEGGRLVAVTASRPGVGRAYVWQRAAGVVAKRRGFDAAVPVLPGFAAEPALV